MKLFSICLSILLFFPLASTAGSGSSWLVAIHKSSTKALSVGRALTRGKTESVPNPKPCNPEDIPCIEKRAWNERGWWKKPQSEILEFSLAQGLTIARLDPAIRPVTPEYFFEAYRQSLKLSEHDEIKLDRTFPSPKIDKTADYRDSRFQQFFKGLEVFGAGYAVHEVQEPRGGNFAVASVLGKPFLGIPKTFDVSPKISKAAAFACALSAAYREARPVQGSVVATKPVSEIIDIKPLALNAKGKTAALTRPPLNAEESEPEADNGILGISSFDHQMKSSVLVWNFPSVTTQDPFEDYEVEINASSETCSVVNISSNLMMDDLPDPHPLPGPLTSHPNVSCDGKSYYDANLVSFIADRDDEGVYRLQSEVFALDPQGLGPLARMVTIDDRQPNHQGDGLKTTIFRDDPDLPGDEACRFVTPDDEVGVAPHYYLQELMKFLYASFGWRGLDGNGKDTIRTYLKGDFSNAYFSSTFGLVFGTLMSDNLLPRVDGETVAHEFGHGLVHATSKNILMGEAWAINEGLSDIVGVLFSFYLNGQNANWQFGEQSKKDKAPSRDLENPKRLQHPTEYNGYYFVGSCGDQSCYTYPTANNGIDTHLCEGSDNCDMAHRNGAVLGHWFYLIAHGGTGEKEAGDLYEVDRLDPDPGVALWKAGQIVFATMKKIPASVTYNDFVRFSLEAARELVTSGVLPGDWESYKKTLTNAWFAVDLSLPYDPRMQEPDMISDIDPWSTFLVWEVYPGETSWQIQYMKEGSLEKPLQLNVYDIDPEWSEKYGKPVAVASINLEPGQTYQWRLKAFHDSPNAAPEAMEEPAQTPTGYVLAGLSPKTSGILTKSKSEPWLLKKSLEITNRWSRWNFFETGSKAPRLVSPNPMEEIPSPWNATFQWEPVTGATGYEILVSENPDAPCDPESGMIVVPVDPEKPENQQGPFLQSKAHLKQETPYYYKVRALGPQDMKGKTVMGDCPTPSAFTTGVAAAPVPILPINSAVPAGPDPVLFKWNKVEGADRYLITVFRNNKGMAGDAIGSPEPVTASAQTFGDVVMAFFTPSGGVPATGLCWKVRAVGPLGDEGPESNSVCFEASDWKPVITSPANGESVPEADLKAREITWEGASSKGYLLFYCAENIPAPVPGEGGPHACAAEVVLDDSYSRPLNNFVRSFNPTVLYVANIVSSSHDENAGTLYVLGAVSDPAKVTVKYPPAAKCGNGIVETGEACDDGNGSNGDGCETNCSLPVCGNGILDAGEQCDGGSCCNSDCTFVRYGEKFCPIPNTDSCQTISLCDGAGQCLPAQPTCGDKVVETGCGEQCDDGNTVGGDSCDATCHTESSTGGTTGGGTTGGSTCQPPEAVGLLSFFGASEVVQGVAGMVAEGPPNMMVSWPTAAGATEYLISISDSTCYSVAGATGCWVKDQPLTSTSYAQVGGWIPDHIYEISVSSKNKCGTTSPVPPGGKAALHIVQ